MPTEENKFYVYEWINKDTGEIFYVGKGSGYRWKRKTASSRNRYFNRYVQKHPNCEPRKVYENLTEEEAYNKERELIAEYKEQGVQLVNFDEGGRRGGRSPGKLNGMYGKTHTPEARKKISEANSDGHNAGIHNTQYGISPRERMSPAIYEQWRTAHKKIVGAANPNCHHTILFNLEHEIVKEFEYTIECARFLEEQEHLTNGIENIRSQIKYYSNTGHVMFNKYYVKVIRPTKQDNTVPSLVKEEGQTTTESISSEKNV